MLLLLLLPLLPHLCLPLSLQCFLIVLLFVASRRAAGAPPPPLLLPLSPPLTRLRPPALARTHARTPERERDASTETK